MIENYTRLSSRMFTATVVGKDKNGRKITEGRETYKTPSGVYEIEDWARLVEKAAEADGRECWEPELARQVKAAGAAGVCTECALRDANTPGGGEKKK